ncbi:protein FAR-RED IMPAIRED RESPONSE 1-like [Henckelia pumila]|uniref:protein FAR-RED IMPAIRED RESPONSE 1-like n=1 Tax=Henckelia pumila TaxID=405737 RepID=UPI003C6E19BF
MGNIHPTAILTDQCESIKIALREVMSDTIHRYCLWHILSKIPQKFKNVVDFDKTVAEFKEMVYDSIKIDTFESKWHEFVRSHGMETSEWLRTLYEEREKWVSVYLNHTFWAGMISTQRSEGIHAYYDGYIHFMSTLKQFVEQYEIATSNKIQKEFRADFESKRKVIKCISRFEWEKQFQRSYTNYIFNLVQKEINRVLYCHIIPPTEEESIEAANQFGIEIFKVLERSIVNNWYHKEFTYTVELRPNGEYINCNCRKFEFKGIICYHIFKVLSFKYIHTVNERYLLRRWRKDVPRRHSSIFFAEGYPHMADDYKKFQEVERWFQDCTNLSIGSGEKMEFVKRKVIDLHKEVLTWNPILTAQSQQRSVENILKEQSVGGTHVLDPPVTRPRGRPRTNRLISASEANAGRGRINTRGTGGGCRGGHSGRGRRNYAQEMDVLDLNQPVIATQSIQVN